MEKINAQDVQLFVDAYQDNKIGDKEIMPILNLLAIELIEKIPEQSKLKTKLKTVEQKNQMADEIASICFQKIDKIDSTRGKAFNFLTTIILCLIRQINRSEYKVKKVKK